MVPRQSGPRVLSVPESLTARAQFSRLAVLGHPIAHSRSPRIHRAAYAQLGLPWRYTAVRVAESQLHEFLATRGPEWRGFSVTMPLKSEAHRLCAVLDPIAQESGVVNTLFRLAGDAQTPRWAGFNTDVAGLAAALRRAGLDLTRTVILGAGATAVSALLAARTLGAEEATVLARRAEAAAQIAARFDGTPREGGAAATGISVRGWALDDARAAELPMRATAVISTLPGDAGERIALPAGITALPMFDVAYDPWPSPLAVRWRAAGGDATPGLDMLVEQALVQVRIFVGGDPGALLPDEPRLLAAMGDAGVGG